MVGTALVLLWCLAGTGLASDPPSASPSPGAETGESRQAQPPPEKKRALPAFHNLRYEEDWFSGSSGPRPPLKFIPLGGDERTVLSLGAQLRLRGENWQNFSFGGPGRRDDGFGLLRLRLHGDLRAGRHLRVFVEGKSSLASGRELPGGNRILDVDSADVQNAFLDLRLGEGKLTLRLGRQELQFGKQRLVSPLDWSNTRPRSFDGLRLVFRHGTWRTDGFWSRHVRTRKYSLNSSHDSGTQFFGIYSAGKLPGTGLDLDLYWLGLDRKAAPWGGFVAGEERHTLGIRLGGAFSGSWDFDVEGAYQFGRHGPRDIRASMTAAQLGHRIQGLAAAPRVYTGLDWASGDRNPSDSRLGTFNQLFPLGHAFLGFIDLVGRQNVVDWASGVSVSPLRRLTASLDVHQFWRTQKGDAFYDAGGAVIRPANPEFSRGLGWETDLVLRWSLDRHTLLEGGWSYFFPGRFLEQSGPAERVQFLYLSAQFTY